MLNINRQNIKFNISFPTALLSRDELEDYMENLIVRKDWIYDINIAARIPPFTVDAHGIIMNEEFNSKFIEQMLYIQKFTNVPVSLTLNNLFIPNDYSHLVEFCENYKPYYDKGLKRVTLPHILWMDYGEIQKRFPDIKLKITTIRQIRTAQDYWNYAIAGYDLINIDRRLLRDVDTLQEIKCAQDKFYCQFEKKPLISIIPNESCVGNCGYLEEHYQYNMTNSQINGMDSYEKNTLPRYICAEYPSYSVRRFYVNGLKDTIDKICENVNIIKLSGRRPHVDRNMVFNYIDEFFDGQSLYPAMFAPIIKRDNEVEIDTLKLWNQTIQRCRYQCWNCEMCDKLEAILAKYYARFDNQNNRNRSRIKHSQ